MVLSVITLAGCSKNKIPDLGLYSDLKLSSIKVNDYTGGIGNTIEGVVTFTFLKTNDTNISKLDTVRFVDTFNVPVTTGHDQNFNFAPPANSKELNVDVSFYLNGGTASSVTMDNMEISDSNKIYLNTGTVYFQTVNNTFFTSTTQSISY